MNFHIYITPHLRNYTVLKLWKVLKNMPKGVIILFDRVILFERDHIIWEFKVKMLFRNNKRDIFSSTGTTELKKNSNIVPSRIYNPTLQRRKNKLASAVYTNFYSLCLFYFLVETNACFSVLKNKKLYCLFVNLFYFLIQTENIQLQCIEPFL